MSGASILFEVVGRTKSERNVRGKHKIIYQVTLKSQDGRHKHVLTDESPELLQQYPYGSVVAIAIGRNPQTTLAKTS